MYKLRDALSVETVYYVEYLSRLPSLNIAKLPCALPTCLLQRMPAPEKTL